MEVAVGAARWIVGKALGAFTDSLLESWAASAGFGPNFNLLKMELLSAQWMLNNAFGRNIGSPTLKELLQKLQLLAYDAEDLLDELDYFCIQDALDGTYHADVHAGGSVHDLVPNARHIAGKHFPCYSFPSVDDDAHTGTLESSNMPVSERRFLFGAWTSKAQQRNRFVQTPKLKFDRVEMSRKMKNIVEQLKPVCAKVSTILNLELLDSIRTTSTRSITQDDATNQPKTTPAIIETKLYGRENQKKSIADSITHGEYCANELTVLPIVGPGGIGKTTFTQHLYDEVKSHFQVPIWICVSLDFNANRLLQEIVKKIPEVNGEKKNCSEEELIEQRLQSKRFLLVLDDMWTYHEDEWKKLLAPFRKGGMKGNMVIVTTQIPEVANMVRTVDSIELERLSDEDTMCFFEACVFGDQQPWKDHDVLREVGGEIVARLKGFPLAAKTVGRLLRNQLTFDHWIRVLDSKEWELQNNDDDIMPALKLSYDYLPSHLQQCFSYCALFPEDYEFNSEELIHLWIGLGLLDVSGQNKRIEDIGLSYLNGLCNHGFFKKEEKANGSHYYVIHDLLHELATKVSSYECLSIRSSIVRSIQIPPYIRHMSIIIDERDVSDRMTFEDCKRDWSTLDKRLKVENLRTLMLFGEYHGSFAKIFGDLFREAKALRVILLSKAYNTVEDVLQLHNLSKFLHLRYLRITTGYYYSKVSLPSTIARLYHLRVLDLKQWNGHFVIPRDMSNLVKLHHFLVRDNKVHSSIFEVGKLIFLQELRSFMVMKENKGFELRQIGQLVVVGGSLGIYNLENVKRKEEADEAQLMHKNHLHELILGWDINRSSKDPRREEHVLESLKPHSNLRELCIRGHGGTNCPTWLDVNFSTKILESLCLHDVAWNKLPPLGELWVVDERGDECQGCITGQSFDNLKRLELIKIPRLKKWVGNGTCHLFSHLEVLIIKNCSELMELPLSRSTCCQPQQEANMTWFPKLRELEIVDCPKLLSLPPIPWTRAPCSAEIARAGSGFEQLDYSQDFKSELRLRIKGNGGQDSVVWKVLSFYNLAELKELDMEKCPPLPLDHLQMLTSLKRMNIRHSSNVLSPVPSESNAIYQFPVEHIMIHHASGKELTQLFSHFPKLTKFSARDCEKITVLGVVEQQTTATPASSPSSPANKMDDAEIGEKQQQTRGGEEIEAAGLLLLPPQLQELDIWCCPALSLRTAGGGLQSLHSLRSLKIGGCPKFLSSSSGFPFPTSLQELALGGVEGMETLAPLSNLISLTQLAIYNCGDLRGEGLWPLVSQGCLTKLVVSRTPKFFVSSEPSRPHEQELLRPSSKLREMRTDNVAGLLVAPICALLSSSLTNLYFEEVERFTEEQEEALHLLTSLQELRFLGCDKLQSLPAGVHRLDNLRRLQIWSCPAIRSLPKGGLPSSLQELNISACPAIRSLPKGGLPSSLRVLDVHYCNSEELRRRCRKLSGTIPIIRA